ncbi:MAG: DUF1329 domain-containing protein [Steroidobacteraceae bacterium]|nr:DUF1329 domain-containing protein [Steroidobacteraceae bacterium]
MIRKTLIAATLAVLSASALAAVSPDEAAKLGKSLTPIGAEKAGNKEGTIPEWTGGLKQIPAGFKPDEGFRPDPYAADKPRLVITGANADQYKAQLTAITYALLKRFPDYRVDVYPTHRPVQYPDKIVQNTAKNAVGAKSVNDGLGMEGALPGYPFPIPKTGNEVMWNHIMRYAGMASVCKYDSYNVDSSGRATLAATGLSTQEFPIFTPENIDTVIKGDSPIWYIKQEYTAPARRAGESLMVIDYANPLVQGRKAWQYLPGQRRVKLAPDICCDTPNPGTAGAATYDDAFVFNGPQDRFDMKLVGKREMLIPYNSYAGTNYHGDVKGVTTPKFMNPDIVRWELHRVWVVEATLKPGKRHIYHKRVFYYDEDSWVAVASDEYDARGELFKGTYGYTAFSYDAQVLNISLQATYDLNAGLYASQGNCGLYWGIKYVGPFPSRDWKPDALAGAGIR